MAASDAKPIPIKNKPYRVTFPILDNDGDLVTGAAGLDSEYSLDAGAFADVTAEATEIATSSGVYYLDLTAAEMNGDTVAIKVKSTTTDSKDTVIILYPALYDPNDVVAVGQVDDGSATTTGFTCDGSDIQGTADIYNGCFLIFISGNLKGIGRRISDWTAGKVVSFSGTGDELDGPLPAAPADDDDFVITGRGE